MAMGRERDRQGDLIVTWAEMPRSPGHVFYDRLQKVLITGGFDGSVQTACQPYHDPAGVEPGSLLFSEPRLREAGPLLSPFFYVGSVSSNLRRSALMPASITSSRLSRHPVPCSLLR